MADQVMTITKTIEAVIQAHNDFRVRPSLYVSFRRVYSGCVVGPLPQKPSNMNY